MKNIIRALKTFQQINIASFMRHTFNHIFVVTVIGENGLKCKLNFARLHDE